MKSIVYRFRYPAWFFRVADDDDLFCETFRNSFFFSGKWLSRFPALSQNDHIGGGRFFFSLLPVNDLSGFQPFHFRFRLNFNALLFYLY